MASNEITFTSLTVKIHNGKRWYEMKANDITYKLYYHWGEWKMLIEDRVSPLIKDRVSPLWFSIKIDVYLYSIHIRIKDNQENMPTVKNYICRRAVTKHIVKKDFETLRDHIITTTDPGESKEGAGASNSLQLRI
tara:strand:- start:11 stop:415 length:405 start_codon:yes stop_codon:yes gene_type:complete